MTGGQKTYHLLACHWDKHQILIGFDKIKECKANIQISMLQLGQVHIQAVHSKNWIELRILFPHGAERISKANHLMGL